MIGRARFKPSARLRWAGVTLGILIPLGVACAVGWQKYQRHNRALVLRELAALRVAVESYAAGPAGTYPAGEDPDWQTLLIRPETRPRLIGAVLRDRFSARGAPYRYSRSGDGRYFIIWSVGPDGRSGITGVDETGRLKGSPGDDLYVQGGG